MNYLYSWNVLYGCLILPQLMPQLIHLLLWVVRNPSHQLNRWSVYVLNASFFIILCSIIYLMELVFICVELIGLVL